MGIIYPATAEAQQIIGDLMVEFLDFVIFSQMLADLGVTMLIVCHYYVAGIGCGYSGFAVIFS